MSNYFNRFQSDYGHYSPLESEGPQNIRWNSWSGQTTKPKPKTSRDISGSNFNTTKETMTNCNFGWRLKDRVKLELPTSSGLEDIFIEPEPFLLLMILTQKFQTLDEISALTPKNILFSNNIDDIKRVIDRTKSGLITTDLTDCIHRSDQMYKLSSIAKQALYSIERSEANPNYKIDKYSYGTDNNRTLRYRFLFDGTRIERILLRSHE